MTSTSRRSGRCHGRRLPASRSSQPGAAAAAAADGGGALPAADDARTPAPVPPSAPGTTRWHRSQRRSVREGSFPRLGSPAMLLMHNNGWRGTAPATTGRRRRASSEALPPVTSPRGMRHSHVDDMVSLGRRRGSCCLRNATVSTSSSARLSSPLSLPPPPSLGTRTPNTAQSASPHLLPPPMAEDGGGAPPSSSSGGGVVGADRGGGLRGRPAPPPLDLGDVARLAGSRGFSLTESGTFHDGLGLSVGRREGAGGLDDDEARRWCRRQERAFSWLA